MFRFLFTSILLFPYYAFPQDTTSVEKIKRPVTKWDTTYYHKFDYSLIVGIYYQFRNLEQEFKQSMNKDTLGASTQEYIALSALNSGLSFCYDKFQFSVSTGSSPQEGAEKKGISKLFNIGLNVGDNHYLFENYFRRFTGFHNSNGKVMDSVDRINRTYYLQPNMRSDLFMSRYMFFSNSEKFSFRSGFGCNYRQLKSAGTWILGASISNFSMQNDSSIFTHITRRFFNDYAGLKSFSSFNLSAHFGAAGTVVLLKAWFLTGYFTLGPEQQWRKYDLTSHKTRLSYVSFSGTGRISFGVNLRKFYMLFSYSNDYNLFNSAGLEYKTEAISGNLTIGWRFNTGNPEFYQKFQKTKLYQLL
jgi:hypothetical protein